jgi:hypothetical protein
MVKLYWFADRKIATTCYLVRNVKPCMSVSTLKIIYLCLYSIMSYGMIFWRNSSYSSVIFKMHRWVIRITMGCGCRESCRELFKELNMLPLSSQYILSLLLFVFNNTDYFASNSVFHIYTTRQRNDLHLPQVTLAMYQKGLCYSGIKICNGLSKAMKDISSNPISLKVL